MKYVWKGHVADSELGNVSAKQTTIYKNYLRSFIHADDKT